MDSWCNDGRRHVDLAVVVGFYLFAAFAVSNDAQWNHIKEAAQVILPAVTSVLGTALGFYFGSQKK